MAVRYISLEAMEKIIHRSAVKTLTWNEPIPDFNTRYPHILESCLQVPGQKFNRKYLYAGLVGKAAILFYLLIKNHPFQNGNKRLAVLALLLFLYVNNKLLNADTKELYNFAVWVASSPPNLKDNVVKAVERFIQLSLVDK